jgi:hypothetical protein
MSTGIHVSPGVFGSERDVSNIVSNISTTTAALVGHSNKGSVDDIVLVTNRDDFINEYGKPEIDKYFHYTALAFLKKGKRLYCKRVCNEALYGGCEINATGSDPAAFSTGRSSKIFDSGDTALLLIYGKDPGVWNGDIGITITDVKGAEDLSAQPPIVSTDAYTFKINVYSKNADGVYQLVESWKVSRKQKVDGYGKQLYLETVINGYSKYIYVVDSEDADTSLPAEYITLPTTNAGLKLESGDNGSDVTDAQVSTGWDSFENPEEIDIRLLLNGGETSTTVHAKMIAIAEARADCFAILDEPWSEVSLSVSAMVEWRQLTQNINSNYGGLYSPWLRINDEYNDTLLYVPPSGYVGAQMAYNDYVANTWNAPAGFNRGILSDVLGVSDVFTEGERDTLYEAQINPIQQFKGEGIVIWGQKTLQVKASALSRINVRRLLIMMEKALSVSLRYFVFEANNELTRFRIVSMMTEYLDLLAAQGAFQTEVDAGYSIICDDRNNTSAVIDRNEMLVDVFVKPSRVAEFLQLRTTVMSSGVSFEELISKGSLL